MEDGAKIGSVVAKGGGRWEWNLRDFSKLPRRVGAFFDSPDFDAEGERWYLQIDPNGMGTDTRMQITLWRVSTWNGKSVSCTVGVKRRGHSEETVGTKTCSGFTYCDYTFYRRRRELEEERGWLPLTLTLLFRDRNFDRERTESLFTSSLPHQPLLNTGDRTSMPRDIRTQNSGRVIVQDSRRDVCRTPEAKANRKVTSRDTQTDVRIGKDEDCTCTTAKGVRRLSENVKELLTEEDEDYDVTLFVKGRAFRAHRLILKVRSPVLSMMLTHDSKEKNSGTIDIPDCDPDCFDAFLLFLYSGRTDDLDTSKALSLYYAADKYDLPDLKEQCVTFLETSLSATSVCDVVLLAARHEEEELLRTATEFFVTNLKTILFTVEWQTFMAQNPTVANELFIKSVQSKDT